MKSSQEYYVGSQWQTRELLETRVRWETRLGQVKLHYDNTPVAALNDHQVLMDRLGAYALDQATDYSPALLGEAALRIPDMSNDEAWPLAKEALERRTAEDCQRATGAQHVRSYNSQLDYQGQHWTQLLLPLYFSYYSSDKGQRYPVWINAQSGAVGGVCLASQAKGWLWAGVMAAVAVGLFLLALVCFALGAVFPPAAIIGTLLAVVALLTGAGALVPAVWPWQWNRRQLGQKVKERG